MDLMKIIVDAESEDEVPEMEKQTRVLYSNALVGMGWSADLVNAAIPIKKCCGGLAY